jgi:hypothetical protein
LGQIQRVFGWCGTVGDASDERLPYRGMSVQWSASDEIDGEDKGGSASSEKDKLFWPKEDEGTRKEGRKSELANGKSRGAN